MEYARLALAAALVTACAPGPDAGSGTTESVTAAASTATTDASTGATGTTASTTEAATTAGTATTAPTTGTATTGEPLPPVCMATSECPQGQHCLKKSCDDVMDEPGCGEFRCYSGCSSPFDRTGFWTCADTQACCGGYPCEGGVCTEHFETDG